jgi:myo-inositol-1(or 4)-monophosphatase
MPTMEAAPEVPAADWLGVCRSAAEGIRSALAAHPTTAERAVQVGRGEGGDMSLVIDIAAEDVVFAELDRLHADGHRFVAVSEERGEVDYGSPDIVVCVDPIDGSLNAKRGLPHHAISIAVADGMTMADVFFGFVVDFGTNEEWTASRGGGAYLNGVTLDPAAPERRGRDGKLEIVGVESADPRWVAQSIEALVPVAYRLRAHGAIAVSMCQVAAARFDGMLSLKRCRSFDAAAAQLIIREAGGHVSFIACETPLAAPLDLIPHSPVVAARSAEGLAELARIPAL